MNPQPPVSGPPARSGPSCWTVGGIGCLIVIVVVFVIAFVGVRSFMDTKAGHQVATVIRSAFNGSREAIACETKMSDVYAAIGRYRAKNGRYPANLRVLTPDYLPDAGTCHCSLDSNPDPAHPTFVYKPPTESSKPADRLLSFTWTQKIALMQQTETVQSVYYFTIAGKTMVQQTTTDAAGRSITNPPIENYAPHTETGG